jgi:hypothetical protein
MKAAAAVLLASLLGGAHAASPPAVLVELFTSEGCSSCPPADAVLARLAAAGAGRGGRVIALGEHVDYWDGLGWKDAFSSPVFTRRQDAYARRLGSGVYTPQLVVAGRGHVLGSNEPAAWSEIATALRAARGEVQARAVPGALEIEARWPGATRADLLVALVRDHASNRVEQGENRGRVLSHVAIARSIEVVGSGAGAFVGRVALEARPDVDRAVVFVQVPDGGPVLAVAEVALR